MGALRFRDFHHYSLAGLRCLQDKPTDRGNQQEDQRKRLVSGALAVLFSVRFVLKRGIKSSGLLELDRLRAAVDEK